jgi:putative methionine-R-sulfoxide reductase with GAF domain
MMNQTIMTKLISQPAKLDSTVNCAFTLKEILKEMNCTSGTIHCYDTEEKMLTLLALDGIPPQLLEKVIRIPLGKGIAGTAAETKDIVHICNLQTDDSGISKPDAKLTEVAGSVAVPILVDGELKGTLGIGKHLPYDFNEDEIEQLWEISHWLGKSIK